MKHKMLSVVMAFAVIMLYTPNPNPVSAAESVDDIDHAHILEKTESVESNCTEDGNSEYWTCSECGRIFSDDAGTLEITEIPVFPATGHSFADGICTKCGAQITWQFDEISGTLTIFSDEGTTEWRDNFDAAAVKSIEIKAGVTQIGDSAFMDCTSVTSVTIPEGVTYLGHYSFYGCTNLEIVTLPKGIKDMGYAMFNNCHMLRSLIIPSSIENIYLPMLEYCESLEYVAYPAAMQIMLAPLTSAKLAYADDGNGGITVRVISDGDRESFHVPDEIEGKTVSKIYNSTESIIIHNHRGGTATCIEQAVCKVCGQTYGDFGPHTEDNGTVIKQPTETETGIIAYSCVDCGVEIRVDDIPINDESTEPDPPINDESAEPDLPPHDLPNVTITVTQIGVATEPYILDESDKRGWEAILMTILNTSDGGNVTVNMNGTTALPKNILSAISGKDIDLVLEMGNGFLWTINGLNVTKAQNIDMGVIKTSVIPQNVVNDFAGEVKTMQISLNQSGDFGFVASLTVDIDKRYDGMYANSYCYKSGEFEFGDSCKIMDGHATLKFTHASSWLILVENSPVLDGVSSASEIHSSDTPIDMSGRITFRAKYLPFFENKEFKITRGKHGYRILKKSKFAVKY